MKLILPLLILATSVASAEPIPRAKLDAMSEEYSKKLRSAVHSAIESYADYLCKVKADFLMEDEFDKALSMDAKISEVSELLDAPEILKAMEGSWRFTTTRKQFHVGIDGTIYGGKPGVRLQIVDSEARLVRVSGHIWKLAEDGRSLSGEGVESGSPHPARKVW